jgi:DNA-binding NtrC family response regulator
MSTTVLLVEDDAASRTFVGHSLSDKGYEVIEAPTLADAHQVLSTQQVQILLLDLSLPDGSGLSLLEQVREEDPYMPAIVITGHGAIESAVSAMKLGASDYVTKPPDLEALALMLKKAEEQIALRSELEIHRRNARPQGDFIVGETAAMQYVTEIIARVAATNASVLILGESGTGKDVVARAIHDVSPRSGKPMVALNCAALPDHLIESELFGHEAGAFTGAHRQKKGLVEVADGSTLFLDEISSMKPGLQAKLLRFLESRQTRRVGSTRDIKVDTRLLAASNHDLQAMIEAGEFRSDLYYRLSVVVVRLPPLRERKVDIPLFVASFLDSYNKEMGKNITDVAPQTLEALKRYDWPGNIRELRNAIERAALFCDSTTLELAHLPAEIRSIR